ncbi:MAG TPA: cytochrome c1 [Micropepsaceae bacterium]|nr:cytochrome c1 [Micropepsaceae bacterium]
MKTFTRIALLCALGAGIAVPVALAAGDAKHPEAQEWSFDGFFGHYDRAALQRGYQVYKENCAACHSMNLIAFRNLGEPGGPEFSEAEVKALAAQYQIPDLDEAGEPITRPGKPFDHFVAPFANAKAAAAANNGAAPPDLSVMAKARAGGPDYLYALLTGYSDPPHGVEMLEGLSYNAYFPGGQIAMPAPLSDGGVTYADGTQATVAQQARDVVQFLMWTAEPKLEERKRLGFMVMSFIAILAGMLYLSYRRLWRDQPH